MAHLTTPDGSQELSERLQLAAERGAAQDPELAALLTDPRLLDALTSPEADDDQAALGLQNIFPALKPYFEPITICDPCVGSGILLLAAAAQFPPWAIHYGWVQFYGMDIDPVCVQMSRLNCQLYGLNGWGWFQRQLGPSPHERVTEVLTATQAQLTRLPEPARSTYLTYQAAHQAGDSATVTALGQHINEVRTWMAGHSPQQQPLLAAGGE